MKKVEGLINHIIRVGEQLSGMSDMIYEAVDAAIMGGDDPYSVRLEISEAIRAKDRRRMEMCLVDVPYEWVYRLDEEIRWLAVAQGRALQYQSK